MDVKVIRESETLYSVETETQKVVGNFFQVACFLENLGLPYDKLNLHEGESKVFIKD